MDIIYTPSRITGYAKRYKLDSVPFEAGPNSLNDHQYKVVTQHPRFDRLVSEGVLGIPDPPADHGSVADSSVADSSTDYGSVDRILDLPYKDVIELIDTITDNTLLLELKDRETRIRVLTAIERKLENAKD